MVDLPATIYMPVLNVWALRVCMGLRYGIDDLNRTLFAVSVNDCAYTMNTNSLVSVCIFYFIFSEDL